MLQDFCRLYLYAAVSCDPVALRAGFQGCVGSMPVGGGSRSVVGWVMWPPVVCAGCRGNWGGSGGAIILCDLGTFLIFPNLFGP